MRMNFRIHPVLVPGEVYELRFVNSGVTGTFLFLGEQRFFCLFRARNGESIRVLYADVRWARG